MIPASYLFKDAYRREFELSDAPVVVEQPRHTLRGLLTPIGEALRAIHLPRLHWNIRHIGGHAYE